MLSVIEKDIQNAPILKVPNNGNESMLRKYIALQDKCWSILGPRRIPAIPCPTQNTNSAISISTSVGFRQLEVDHYIDAANKLQPDITVSIADLITAERSSPKRVEKSADRTHGWLRDTLGAIEREGGARTVVFASIPPLERGQQSFYLSDLGEDFSAQTSGVVLYDSAGVDMVPDEISRLPRLCLTEPKSPHSILAAVASGIDLVTVPLATASSEDGVAFSFSFPGSSGVPQQPLGIDLWSSVHATDLSPLASDCECYTCKRHHRAYLHHLLQAREMLAWTLLQVHNFAILDRFFHNVRQSIASSTFEADMKSFGRTYDNEMPERTGEGPRVRGYQMKSVGGGEGKRNPKAYGRLDDAAEKIAEAQSGVATPTGNAEEMQDHGFAEKSAPSS